MTKKIIKLIRKLNYYKILCSLVDTSGILILSFMGFAIPLYYDYSVNNIYVLPKVVLMRNFTIILLAIFFFRIIFLKGKITKPPFFYPIISFFIFSSLATSQSLNPFVSLFGCYSRYEGLTSLLNYIILFYLSFFFIKKGYAVRIFFVFCVISGILCGGYGVLQHFNKDPNWLVEMGESSTFGNRNFLSAYLVLICPLSFVLFILSLDDKIKKNNKGIVKILFNITKIFLSSFFLLSFLFFIISIIIIRTRGAWLGLLGSLILFFLLLGKKRLFKKRYIYVFLSIFFSIFLLFFFKQTSPIERILETFKREEKLELAGSALARIYMWKSIIPLIIDHPLGIGPDSLKFVIPLYLSPDYWTVEGGVVDKAHNIILEIAATTGWFGILSYLWLLISLFIFGIKNRKNLFTIAILSLITGYFIQNIFNFDLVTYTFLFWTSIGIMGGINTPCKNGLIIKNLAIRIILSIVFIPFLIFLWKASYIQLAADKIFASARNYEASGDLDTSISLYEKALSILPYEETYFRFLIPQYRNKIGRTEDKNIIKDAILRISDAMRYDPNNTSYYETLAFAYHRLYQLGEKYALKKEEESLRMGVKRNPNSPETWTNLGVFYAQQGRIKDAIRTYNEALKYQAENTRGRILTLNNLGEVYFTDNQLDKAIKAFSSSLHIAPNQPEIYHYIARIYFKKKDYKNAVLFCEKAISFKPNDVQLLNDLGSSYFKANELKKAKEAFKKAILLDPSNSYAKRVISIIPDNP